MDLVPYGIHVVLEPTTNIRAILHKAIAKSTITKNAFGDYLEMQFPSGKYTIMKQLGQGSYGKTFLVLSEENESFVVKCIDMEHLHRSAVLKECIIQILLYEESKERPSGPFVPRFYELAYCAKEKSMMLRSEPMDDTLGSILVTNTQEENDVFLPQAIMKLAKILQFFETKLAFNHRDLKTDNIMFQRMDNNRIRITLIDFGLSCLTWKGLRIEGEGGGLRTCFKQDRDLSQLMYELARYETDRISDRLYNRLAHLLEARIDPDHICNVLEDCMDHGLRNWTSSYGFFNRPNVHMHKADAKSVQVAMKTFLEPMSAGSNCGKMHMRNPKTRRCRNIPLPISLLQTRKNFG